MLICFEIHELKLVINLLPCPIKFPDLIPIEHLWDIIDEYSKNFFDASSPPIKGGIEWDWPFHYINVKVSPTNYYFKKWSIYTVPRN